MKTAVNDDGYLDDDAARAIRFWDFRDGAGWLAYIHKVWNHHYGCIWEEDGKIKLATGGWSENEDIVSAMRANCVLWSLLWDSSYSGGLYVLRVPNDASDF